MKFKLYVVVSDYNEFSPYVEDVYSPYNSAPFQVTYKFRPFGSFKDAHRLKRLTNSWYKKYGYKNIAKVIPLGEFEFDKL